MTNPLSPKGESVERQWRDALQSGPDCVPLERMEAELTAVEQAHVAGCARCQAELALFSAVDAETPRPGEGAAVAWIAAETRRRLAAEGVVSDGRRVVAMPAPRRRFVPTWTFAAAAALAAVGGVWLLQAPSLPLATPGAADVYRSARVEIAGPSGDVDVAPDAFTWSAVTGATQYEVRVREVDGTEVWRGTSAAPRVALPDAVRALALPAKTLVWQVTAKDAAGRTLADSGETRFRVRLPRPPTEERREG